MVAEEALEQLQEQRDELQRRLYAMEQKVLLDALIDHRICLFYAKEVAQGSKDLCFTRWPMEYLRQEHLMTSRSSWLIQECICSPGIAGG